MCLEHNSKIIILDMKNTISEKCGYMLPKYSYMLEELGYKAEECGYIQGEHG